MTSIIANPASYVPQRAIAFGALNGAAQPVERARPLPVEPMATAAQSTPLAGSASASGAAGPFTPDLGRAIWLTLSGSWTGTVRVLRSTDGGTTRLPLTAGGMAWAVYSGNVQEPVREESVAGATYWLDIALTAGTVAYEVRQ